MLLGVCPTYLQTMSIKSCCCWVTSVLSNSVRPHRQQPTRLPHPRDSPGKNTGVGCHFLLQCRKVKSESEVAQSCPTLSDPMDYSLPGSSIHGIFQARVLEWFAIVFSNVYSSFIHICQRLEATKMPFSRWMDKLWYIQTTEYYSALKRNELSNHKKTWRKLNAYY